jgi:hypothetical protein
MGLYIGIFLVTLSGLMFEIALTRIFSATIWYHFAFVAISVALLGWGLGGFALHLLRRRLAFSRERAALSTFLYALSIPLALWLIVRTPFHYDRLIFYFTVSLVPFFLAGVTLSMLFTLGRENAGRLYFADLLGASLGALTVTFLLALGGENAVLAVSIAPFVAAALFSTRLRVPSALAIVLVLAAIGLNQRTHLFSIRSAPTKGLYRQMKDTPGTRIALTGWNAYSRIDAVTGFASPYLARLYIDSDAWTNIIEWDGRVESLSEMRTAYRALPFELVPPRPSTLVIGPGGGSDVLYALAAGSQKVTAVEMNPLMLRFVRHFGAQAGHIYDHQPLVEPILSEGRTFVRRTDRSFDVVLMGFVDSWAAVASGGLSLSENHLYTVEAFRDYLDHLTPDGQLVIMRWPVDAPRLVSNAVALLGAEEAGRRVAVLLEKREGNREDPPQMVFMLKKRPWTAQETERMASWAGVQPVIVPGWHVDEPYASLFSGRTTLAQYVDQATSRVDPVFDDRPFFFARAKPWGLPSTMRIAFGVMLAAVVAVCALFLAFGKPRGEPAGPYAGSIAYFACLGVGFIAVELALLQHLTLLLGHPIFTLSILLFTLLASGGVGSRFAGRFPLGTVCLGVAALAAVYALALPRVVPLLLPLLLGARITIAIVLVAPLGFLMGMPFPSGLRETGHGPFPLPPFYWGLNGIFSVIGSLATIGLAVVAGFTWAMLAGAAFYAVAALASRAFGARSAQAVETAA